MAEVRLINISKMFGSQLAVAATNLEIADGEFLVLVGPSGCGKTTTLRMVAGLEEPSSGQIVIGNRDVTYVEPKDRDIAMVFQNYALYPHMTVHDNMAYSLRLRKTPITQINERITTVAEMLGITGLLSRYPRELSGGQQQRVALGRAIVRNSKVFLMDEPLSNLDAKLRVQTRAELIKLHQQLQTTTLYVTHDQVEAMTMGTCIVVMKDGIIQQTGKPLEIYNNPNNMFVASFIGSPAMQFFRGCVQQEDDKIYFAGKNIKLILPNPNHFFTSQQQMILGIRPENIILIPENQDDKSIRCKVEVVENIGSEALLHTLTAGGEQLIIRLSSPRTLPLPGHTIHALPSRGNIHLFNEETGKCIATLTCNEGHPDNP